MSVHPAGGPSPHAPADAVLVLDARSGEGVRTVVLAEAPQARVVTASDRQTFLTSLQATRWSLVIVSFDLEAYPGTQALRDARTLSSAPVIATGAAAAPGDVARALREGAEDFIECARTEVLAARVSRVLGVAQAKSRLEQDREVQSARGTSHLQDVDATLLLDLDWRIADCGAGTVEVLGYQPSDLVGRAFDSLFVAGPGTFEFLRHLRGEGEPASCSDATWMLRRDGLQMWAQVSCVPDPGEDGQPRRFHVTVRDATLQYRATQSVRVQADAAAAAIAGRNLFLGSIAHELRGALAPVTTSVNVLQRVALEPAQHDRLVGIIQRNAASAARLVEDLLTFSTASENKLLMRQEEVDLHQLVSECVEAAQHHAAAGNIALRMEGAPGEARSRCDAGRIRQVVVNLIGNAIKFTPAGGNVRVRTCCGPDSASIEVTDDGAGIAPEVLPHIFEPFEQGGSETTSRFGGFGLGLAISAVIAKQHGGSIDVSSPGRGQGATFRLSLPRERDGSAPADSRPKNVAGLQVLYVEDNADAADAMHYALTRLGWSMVHAPTCARARELVRDERHSFDVVLADLGLPDGSGVELGRELSRHLPVVALTAYGAPLGLEGFANQLMKPAEIAELHRALLRAVAVHGEATL